MNEPTIVKEYPLGIKEWNDGDFSYGEDDLWAQSFGDAIMGTIGFCPCGQPGLALDYIRKGLKTIDRSPDQTYDEWRQSVNNHFKSPQEEYFFYYWADKEHLTDHGGSVPGWLTDKGKSVLKLIEELEEYEKVMAMNVVNKFLGL